MNRTYAVALTDTRWAPRPLAARLRRVVSYGARRSSVTKRSPIARPWKPKGK